jgi:hypothetical protein
MTTATLLALRELAQPAQAPTPTGYRVKPWPNGIGFDVVAGGRTYEVWEHGAVSRLVKDVNPCGFSREAYQASGVTVRTPEDAAKAVNLCIRRGVWTPCE